MITARVTSTPNRHIRPWRPRRKGAILVWFVITLTLLLGFTGLVIDSGYLMASYRHLQNSVDAAALAAADELVRGGDPGQAVAVATDFVHVHNRLDTAQVTVNIPPQSGPFAGNGDYVEVIASLDVSAYFIYLLPGTDQKHTVRTRAVAGIEWVPSTYGILALDATARPALSVTGNARLTVYGGIAVNSEGGGVDENGEPLPSDDEGVAAFVSRFGRVRAVDVRVVGGVNSPDAFKSTLAGEPNPLHARQLPVPDPFLRLPTPTVANGVVDEDRGHPRATDDVLELNNPNDLSVAPNYIYMDQDTNEQVMVLQPGIYSSISITGGRVEFVPGIYVVKSSPDQITSLDVTGGNIVAQGIMFYNTGEDYDPIAGEPNAVDDRGPAEDADFGRIRLDASLGFSALDTRTYVYPDAPPSIATFNGMLIYQRRGHGGSIQLHGFGIDNDFHGTVYASTADVWLPSRGTYNSQFIAGTVRVPGHGDVTVDDLDGNVGTAPRVFLVE